MANICKQPAKSIPGIPIEERFWTRLRKMKSGCWEWQGTRPGGHYGRIMFRKKQHTVTHRVAWELAHGPIPKGMLVLHKCDNRACCNPKHLFLGTAKDNFEDMRAKGRWYNHFAHKTYAHKGEANGVAKLTEVKVRRIRKMRASGSWTLQALAEKFDVSKKLILLVVHRRAWAHVK